MSPSSFLQLCAHAYFRCTIYCVLFITGLYIYGGFNRRHIQNVRRRILSATICCFFIFLDTLTFIRRPGSTIALSLDSYEFDRIFLKSQHLGLALFLPAFVTLLLFSGSLWNEYQLRITYHARDWINELRHRLDLRWIRTVVVAPCVEEFIFRGCILFHLQREQHLSSCWSLCIGCAFFFALSHFHHVFENVYMGHSWIDAISICIPQVIMTAFFGLYSTFIVLRTGHLLAACSVHAFCNQAGLPDLKNELQLATLRRGKRGRHTYLAFLFAGAFAWLLLILPATSPILFSNARPLCCC